MRILFRVSLSKYIQVSALFLALILWPGFFNTLYSADKEPSLILKFPTPLKLEHMWTFREHDGLDPPQPGVVFWIGSTKDDIGRFLAITNERVRSSEKFQKLLTTGLRQDDPDLYYEGVAPPRMTFFHRMDLDADGCDEVLMTGRGGAGGTSLLTVFKITGQKVKVIFEDTSRFGFRIFDETKDGIYELANPGFEWVPGPVYMQPKEFKIYRLQTEKYQKSRNVSAELFWKMVKRSDKDNGIPLSATRETPIIRVHE